MTACVLCLVSSDAGIGLQSAEGVRLGIRATINKHFSFPEVSCAP